MLNLTDSSETESDDQSYMFSSFAEGDEIDPGPERIPVVWTSGSSPLVHFDMTY